MDISERSGFRAEAMGSAKALRWKHVWSVWSMARKPVGLKRSEGQDAERQEMR